MASHIGDAALRVSEVVHEPVRVEHDELGSGGHRQSNLLGF